MVTVSIAVEGASDVAAVQKILATKGIEVDPQRIFVTRGKANLDKKLPHYNKAAQRLPWFVLRDSDQDEQDCPVQLRSVLINRHQQNPGLCLRLAVRSVESWLLADSAAFARFFGVVESIVPADVDALINPKHSLVDLCRRSRRKEIRQTMVPPKASQRTVGPEYVTKVSDFCRDEWRPDVAAERSPSLARTLSEIERLVAQGHWV